MIFLNPAVLFGLLAASIPILIHILNRRKLKKVEFSTLAFLKEIQKNKIRKVKIKQFLLLALRVLIIVFIVGAFARPTLKNMSLGGVASAAKTSAVFILDNTYSMSVVNNKGSYFNQAKGIVNILIDQLQEGDDASIIFVSDFNKSAQGLSSNLNNLKNEVSKAQIDYYSGTINEAIAKAAKLLEKSKNYNKEIYIISDLQKDRLFDNGSVSDLGDDLNKNVRIYYVDFPQNKSYNIGIQKISLNTQIFETNKPVSFNVTVKNYSDKTANNVVVSLFINNKRSAQQSVNLESGESRIITMESIVKDHGFVNISAELEDDDILQDNMRFINLYIPEEIPIAIFSDSPDDSRFIQLALKANPDSSLHIVNKGLDQMSSTNLNQYSLVILVGTSNSIPVDNLKSYLQQGKGLFIIPGSNTELNDFQNLCNSLSLPEPTVKVNSSNDEQNYYTFDKVDLSHPIFQDLFLKDKNKIESPNVYQYFKIDTKGEGRNIISLTDGSAFLSEYDINKGKVFVLASAAVLSWSNFPVKSIFVPLINKSAAYLSSKNISNDQYLAGSSVNINVSNVNIPQIKIVKPDKSEEYFNIENNNGYQFFNYENTNQVGNYLVYSGKDLINDFSVNFDPRESDIEKASEQDIRNYFDKINYKGNLIKIDYDSNIKNVVLQSRFGSELWKIFIVIALTLALIEMAVSRSSKKDIIEQGS
jgi:Aerotolerance regulator N-terminal/von Willebrand factor type A domain